MDISSYYHEHYVNTHYLNGLWGELAATNFVYPAAGGTRPRRVELGMNRHQFALRIQMEQE